MPLLFTSGVEFDIQCFSMECQTIFSGHIKQQSVLLVGYIHVFSIGREAEPCRFVRIFRTFQYGQELTLGISSMHTGESTAVFGKIDELSITGWTKLVNPFYLVWLAVKETIPSCFVHVCTSFKVEDKNSSKCLRNEIEVIINNVDSFGILLP